jgi:CRP/FNR family cyclic AMP-dependent transcriptional regulator
MKKKVLIIEASKEIRENTAELLELRNYRVITAENGCSGFEKAKQFYPDLIICDLTLPGTDGYTFLQLVEKNPAIYRILIIFFLDCHPNLNEINGWMNIAKGIDIVHNSKS